MTVQTLSEKCEFLVTTGLDLSDALIIKTYQTLDQNAGIYASRWEWNSKTIQEVKRYNINPFIKYANKNNRILVVGCKTGRDLSLFSAEGLSCVGISSSYGMLKEAKKRVPDALLIRSNENCYPFMPETFSMIYADALTTIPRSRIKNALNDFKIILKRSGFLYVSVKVHKSDGVLEVSDDMGKRYMTVYSIGNFLKIIDDSGYEVLWQAESPHTDRNLPGWLSLIVRKR